MPPSRDIDLDEMVATPEEWESDPFGVAASIIRKAVLIGISYEGAMSDHEYHILLKAKELVD